MGLTDWDKKKSKATENIGFISRSGWFREPSPAEIARAIIIETESWQMTKGLKPYTLSAEYKTPKGHEHNLLQINENEKLERKLNAIQAYRNIPMGVPFENPTKEKREYLFVTQAIIFIVSILFFVLIIRKGIK